VLWFFQTFEKIHPLDFGIDNSTEYFGSSEKYGVDWWWQLVMHAVVLGGENRKLATNINKINKCAFSFQMLPERPKSSWLSDLNATMVQVQNCAVILIMKKCCEKWNKLLLGLFRMRTIFPNFHFYEAFQVPICFRQPHRRLGFSSTSRVARSCTSPHRHVIVGWKNDL
jgi:hypothetical protein